MHCNVHAGPFPYTQGKLHVHRPQTALPHQYLFSRKPMEERGLPCAARTVPVGEV